jgi:L-fuculose-phosphate aldolase
MLVKKPLSSLKKFPEKSDKKLQKLSAQSLITVAQRLYEKNFLASADGNISLRLTESVIMITPKGVNKARIQTRDLCLITLDNKVLCGQPSSERLMHLEIYKNCPQAKAVVHAHPPHAVAWSIAFPKLKELPKKSLSELILAVGQIPIVPYQRPGSQNMGLSLKKWLPQQRVFILSRHGALSWGEDLEEAYNGMERLEHTALILSLAQNLKGLTELPPKEISYLKKMRTHLGPKTF